MVTTFLCNHNCQGGGTWKRRNSQNGKLSATYILYKLLLSSCQWQKTDLFPHLFNSRKYNHHRSHDVSMPSLFFIIRSKETIVTDTNIFCFSPASPNTLYSEGRTWCLGARGIWARDHRDYSTLLLGAMSPSGSHSWDYGDTGENRGTFYFVETGIAFLESNGNSNKLAFFGVFLIFFHCNSTVKG